MFQTDETQATAYIFSQDELKRLIVYRAAVQAGFYNEGLPREQTHQKRRTTRATNMGVESGLDTDLRTVGE